MMKSLIQQLLIFLAIVTTTWACKKTEEVVVVHTPMKVIANAPTEVRDSQITMHGEIENINDEEILDVGFILSEITKTGSTLLQEISAGKQQLTAGKTVDFTLNVKEPFDLDLIYQYVFYVKTAKGFYKSPPVRFNVDNISVTDTKLILVYLGETIVLKGNFKQFKENYYLIANSDPQQRLAFTLKDNKTTLAVTLPKGGYYHGNTVGITLQKPINGSEFVSSKQLIETKIVAKITEPSKYSFAYNEDIQINGIGLPQYNTENLFLLINDKRIPFVNHLLFKQLVELKSGSFRLGYTNGRDSVYLAKEIQLEQPSADDFELATAQTHPGCRIETKGINFYKYFGDEINKLFIGSSAASGFIGNNGYSAHITVPNNLPEGKYPITLTSGLSTVTSKQQLEVKKLHWNTINQNTFFTGDTARLTGNFYNTIGYNLEFVGGPILYSYEMKNDLVSFKIPQLTPGKYKIKTFYYGFYNSEKSYAPEEKTIEIAMPIITDFSPHTVTSEYAITLQGKGLSDDFKFYFGDQEVNAFISDAENKRVIYIPHDIKPGKYKVWMSTKYGKVEAKTLLEIK
ncbi:hypothetical protein [Sphingobacterium sp.]|uniref:hypothetical protein n=1 Tax=Sphingobacterium sp. TaxID=341027 RepID=UPI00258A0FC7|nr:hypothetical protein [Sphingobacterium sp.]WET69809.1 MAG: hypothetical protein P0Y57_01710 [Sphingobacterium sp.]